MRMEDGRGTGGDRRGREGTLGDRRGDGAFPVSAAEANSRGTVEKDRWGRTTVTIPRKQRRGDETTNFVSPTFVSVTLAHTHTPGDG